MKKNIIIAVLAIILIITLTFVVLPEQEPETPPPEDEPVETEEEEEDEDLEESEETEEVDFEERLEVVLEDFLGADHMEQPLDEDNLYTEEGFDSTTLVLSLAAKANSEEDPEEEMKKVHYYPPGEVSYENRLHFTTYRNEVSDYFEDITDDVVGSDYVKTKTVTLNKEREDEGRLIDIDWEEEVEISYVETQDISFVIPNLPEVVGVAFLREGDEDRGLDVRTEAVLKGGVDIIYASGSQGEVVREDFLEYLEESGFDGAVFYEFKQVNN